jgi:hypothetical protein
MKIGIFGDSFADWSQRPGLTNVSWPYLLSQTPGIELFLRSASGAPMWWSYNEFLTNQHNCDTVIFLCTSFGRYTKPVFIDSINQNVWVAGYSQAEWYLNNEKLSPIEKLTFENICGHFKVLDWKWEEECCNMLIDKILAIRPDTILIPCFDFYKERFKNHVSLEKIQALQLKSLGILHDKGVWETMQKYYEDKIVCHFTEESNKFVLDCMLQTIKNKSWTCNLPERIEHKNHHSYYYKYMA